jgi:hypothetical protein
MLLSFQRRLAASFGVCALLATMALGAPDNYLTLLPHEPRKVDIRCPAGGHCSQIQLRGWNVVPAAVNIDAGTVRHSKSEYDVGKQ